jgi:hypothetical protein
MKEHMQDKYKFTLKLVPPGCHGRYAAEVAIRNFKAHYLSVLASTAPMFPPSLWDKLLPQMEITLNLLHQSNATQTVSAYAHLIGPFDYNKMPLAPMGCEVQVHEKTDKRGSWAYSYENKTCQKTDERMSHTAASHAHSDQRRQIQPFTAGGDKINYPGEVAAPTADMLVAKILFNSVISTPGARFGTMDISNFYLMTPLLFQNTFEYTSPTFQTKSYKNTNSKTKQQPKVSSISKLSRACTVSLKQDY